MRISRSLVEEMIAHAREDLPNECCGMVGGKDGEATTVYRARNEFATPYSFRIDTADQYRIMEVEMRERGEELLAIYHSHTKTAAYPSQTDLNEAEKWPEPMYVIVSLQDPDEPVVNGFWLRDLKIAEAELVVE
jgi:[CysO sulfur-carrier protein]-S-L-cysteine hydrolase